MNRPRRTGTGQHRRPPAKRPVPVDIWREMGPLPDVEPIALPHDAGALLRSLGDPPVGGGNTAGHYFNAVVERAAAVAIALAVSAEPLAVPDDD